MFRENAFVSEYDAGKFYGINQRMTLLLSRSQVTAQGTQVMTQVELGTAGACNARRSHVRSSTKLAPSRRVSTKIGSASSYVGWSLLSQTCRSSHVLALHTHEHVE